MLSQLSWQKPAQGQREIDIKKYVKIEKIPGGAIEDCRCNTLNGHSFHAFRLLTV